MHMTRLHESYGPVVGISNPGHSIVFCFGAEANKQLLRDPALFHSIGLTVPGPMGSAQRRVSTNSLFSMNGSQNRDRRGQLMPPMQKNVLGQYYDKIVDVVRRTLDEWRGRETTDLLMDMKRLAMSTSGRCLFGVDLPVVFPELAELFEYWVKVNCSVSVRLSDENAPSAAYRRMLTLAERVETKIMQVLEYRTARLRDDDWDVMSILLRAREAGHIGYPELVGQATILLAAAYETTSDALTWTLFLLEQHPEILADLADEISAELGGNPPRPDQLDKLPMLERVIKESMRVLGPAVHNSRFNIRPVTIGGYDLPRGSTLIFSHYITHRDPEVYRDPARFDPARWETIKPTPYEYIPFGAGPRMCIGASFAMMTMKIALGTILQHHRFALSPDARIDRTVETTLTPKYGVPARVFPQDRAFAASTVRGNIHDIIELPTRVGAMVG